MCFDQGSDRCQAWPTTVRRCVAKETWAQLAATPQRLPGRHAFCMLCRPVTSAASVGQRQPRSTQLAACAQALERPAWLDLHRLPSEPYEGLHRTHMHACFGLLYRPALSATEVSQHQPPAAMRAQGNVCSFRFREGTDNDPLLLVLQASSPAGSAASPSGSQPRPQRCCPAHLSSACLPVAPGSQLRGCRPSPQGLCRVLCPEAGQGRDPLTLRGRVRRCWAPTRACLLASLPVGPCWGLPVRPMGTCFSRRHAPATTLQLELGGTLQQRLHRLECRTETALRTCALLCVSLMGLHDSNPPCGAAGLAWP